MTQFTPRVQWGRQETDDTWILLDSVEVQVEDQVVFRVYRHYELSSMVNRHLKSNSPKVKG